MMIDWKPQKGKAYDKLPKKTLDIFDTREYYVSKKYDGNQIFIVRVDDVVRWFTSDWKEFNLPNIGKELLDIDHDFILVAEMNYEVPGKKGDRVKVQGKITTERTRFNKGLDCSLKEHLVFIKVFDYLTFDSYGLVNLPFSRRWELLGFLVPKLPGQIRIVHNHLMSGKAAKIYSKKLFDEGWEGCMCMEPDEYYYIGKRVNHSVKLKPRPTADLKCIDVVEGEDKYTGMIGSLTLKDSEGRTVNVGSGLNDEQRGYHEDYFIGQIIEIEYEQILATYQQPVFIRVRDDKYISE